MQETILESAVFSAFLHEVVFSFPPPAALEFQHRLKEWKKLGISRVGPLDLRLSDSYQHHTVAVTAVVSAWLDSTYLSWNEALRTVKENWPEWGAPYLLAHLADGDDRHLEAAERLCAVRDPLLLRRLNHAKVRMQGTTLGDQVSQRAFLTVLRSIATHHPSLINLHHWATKAAFYRRFGQIAEMLSLLYQVHGDDPAKWTAVDTYESLVAAGSLCQFAAATAHHAGGDRRTFNAAAIEYLKRAIGSPGRLHEHLKGDYSRSFAKVRLATVYAHMLRHLPAGNETEEDEVFFREAESFIRQMGLSRTGYEFTAFRCLSILYSSMAVRAKALGRPQAEIARWVDSTDEIFQSLHLYAYPAVKEIVYSLRWEFIESFGRDPSAVMESALPDGSVVRQASATYRTGKRVEAIRMLVKSLKEERPNPTLSAERLIQLLMLSEEQGIVLPQQLHTDAHSCARRSVPLLVAKITHAVRQREYRAAAPTIRLARYADPEAQNILQLAARAAIQSIQDDEQIPTLIDELREVIRQGQMVPDDYLRGSLLELVHKGAITGLPEEQIWSLASAPTRRGLDKYNLFHALAWQIRVGSSTDLGARVLFAAKAFPFDGPIQSLLSMMCSQEPQWAFELISQVRSPSARVWLASALRFVPPAFFATFDWRKVWPPSGEFDGDESWRRLAYSVVDGLVRDALMFDAASEDVRTHVHARARQVALLVPSEGAPHKWSQWLGGELGVIERSEASRLKLNIETLKQTVIEGDDDRRRWVQTLERFIATNTSRETGSNKSIVTRTLLVDRCISAARGYRQMSRESSYWRDLSALTMAHIDSLSSDAIVDEFTDLRLEVNDSLRIVFATQIANVVKQPLHEFKNELKDIPGQQVPERWKRRFLQVIDRTVNYLQFHRAPQFETIDLRHVVARAALRAPFVSPSRDSDDAPRLWCVRLDEPVLINGDAILLNEVFTACLNNSAACTPTSAEGGWIWIRVAIGQVSAVTVIQDNGAGLEKELLSKLNDAAAEPFSLRGSTGFGTRLIHRIVLLHGGQIEFHSDGIGTGMKILITFPLAET